MWDVLTGEVPWGQAMEPECNTWDRHVGRRGLIGTRCHLISICLLQCICAHKQNKSNNEKSCREELRHTMKLLWDTALLRLWEFDLGNKLWGDSTRFIRIFLKGTDHKYSRLCNLRVQLKISYRDPHHHLNHSKLPEPVPTRRCVTDHACLHTSCLHSHLHTLCTVRHVSFLTQN